MLRLGLLLNSKDMNDIDIELMRSMATTWNVRSFITSPM